MDDSGPPGGRPTRVEERTHDHPCYNPRARLKYARVHLPVARRCNIQCGFCNRKYDCTNESRPGVTSQVISPQESVELVRRVKERFPSLSVVGIAGPGDPLANPEEVFETIERITSAFPELRICLSTNGLVLPDYVDEIARHAVEHVTITINAIDARIASQIYPWITYKGKLYRGVEGAEILLANQQSGLRALVARNILVKINTVLMPDINDQHIPQIAEYVSRAGAVLLNIVPLIPVGGTLFEDADPPETLLIRAVQRECRKYIQVMGHCAQCRADAIGFLGKDTPMGCFTDPSRTITGNE